MLLHGDREVRAALHRRVVGDDQRFASMNAPDAGDEPGRRRPAVVHSLRGKGRELKEGTARIQQRLYAFTRQKLPAGGVLAPRILAAAEGGLFELLAEVRHQS